MDEPIDATNYWFGDPECPFEPLVTLDHEVVWVFKGGSAPQ